MNRYLMVLREIHQNPQTFQSNHFRGNADLYAEAASRGHITCLIDGRNAGKWHISNDGLEFLTVFSRKGESRCLNLVKSLS